MVLGRARRRSLIAAFAASAAAAWTERVLADRPPPAGPPDASSGLLDPGPLTAAERAALERGGVVRREIALDLAEGHFVGGVAYVVVQAPPGALMSVLGDVTSYTEILPLCVEARLVGESGTRRGGEAVVAIRHKGRYGGADYAMRIARERSRVRFWLERSLPHDLDDAWGYFRVEPAGADASLLTYAALMDVGFIARLLFEERVRDLALGTPQLVKDHVERRWAAVLARRRRRREER